MKGKRKGLAFLVAVSILAAGCSTHGNAQIQETVIVNEDVQLESSLADSNLEVSRQQDIEIGRNITNQKFHKVIYGEKIYFNEEGKFYSLDFKTGEEKKLADQEVREISGNGNWALAYEEGKIFIHNLKNGKVQLLENGSPEDSRFVGDEVAYFDYNTHTLSLISIEKNETAIWDLSKYEDATISSIKKTGDDVYIAARSEENGYGVYQLTDQGQINTVANFGGEDTQFNDFDLLQDGSLLFNGTYDGKTGIYYWDKTTNGVQQLVSGGKDSEGIWVPFYNLSPDESKIMFDMPVQIEGDFKTNVYMAEIADGQLTNSVRIMENTDDLYAVISLSGHWSEDSKTAYITTSKDNHERVGDIAVFQLKE
ncbi:hypothetical protein ACFPRA_17340 [Sporosarcina soli]|uniref:Lipoprotein n=1 Tax=Sporosarcina soli TaxID=334736 RepID=A0ABW0TNY8_9BACL